MKILLINHEGPGLGHLKRLTFLGELLRSASHKVLLISSHHNISFISNIEHIKIPSVNTFFSELNIYSNISFEEFIDFRNNLICQSIDFFNPDVIILDHLPFGRDYGILKKKEFIDIVNKYQCRFFLILRGVLDGFSMENENLNDDFVNPLFEKFSKILVCFDFNLLHIDKENTALSKFKKKFAYIGFIFSKLSKAEIISIRNKRLGLNSSKKWCIISGGSGKYYSKLLYDISVSCLEILKEDWEIDLITGPYGENAYYNQIYLPPNIQIHSIVKNLFLWHGSADLLITPGGSNTILEGIFGNPIVIPIRSNYQSDIPRLTEIFNKNKFCFPLTDIADLGDVLRNFNNLTKYNALEKVEICSKKNLMKFF